MDTILDPFLFGALAAFCISATQHMENNTLKFAYSMIALIAIFRIAFIAVESYIKLTEL